MDHDQQRPEAANGELAAQWSSLRGMTPGHSVPGTATQAPSRTAPPVASEWAGAYPPPRPSSQGRPWVIAGGVCAGLALIFVPIVLGPLGAAFGFIGRAKGDAAGLWVGIAGIVTTIVGIILGIVILSAVS